MSITTRVISDICRTKYGAAIDAAVRNIDVRDIEDLIENIAWGKADDMYQQDRRFQDVDHAMQELSRGNDAYRSVVGFSAMVVIGLALDTLEWFEREYDRELPRQLMIDADTAYRSVLRDSGDDNSGGSITSGYKAGADNHQQTNPRLANRRPDPKYVNHSASGFAAKAKNAQANPKYDTGGVGGFASRMRNEHNYEAPVEYTPEPEVVIKEVPSKLYATPKELLAFNINTGEIMESYEMHEIKATKTQHVGVDLPVSKLVQLSSSADASIKLNAVESEVHTTLDAHPSALLMLPTTKSIRGAISTALTNTETQFTIPTDITDRIIEAFNNSALNNILRMLDTYKEWITTDGYPSDMLSYMVTIISRQVSQVMSLELGEVLTILPNPGQPWVIKLGDLTLDFDSIEEAVQQLLGSNTYSWAADGIATSIENGYISERISIGVEGAVMDDIQSDLRFVIKQRRTLINAPGHLDTNISHIDNGCLVEVNKSNNHVFATALRCIEDKLVESNTANGAVILVDDFGYALEFATAKRGNKLYVQRYMTY